MKKGSRLCLRAALTVTGTIIGAGIFALPAMFQRFGVWSASLVFWLVALVVCATHLLYVQVILSRRERRRLSGYAAEMLGGWGEALAMVSYPLQIVGVNMVYIVLGAAFLAGLGELFGWILPYPAWQTLFWGLMVVDVALGLRFLSKLEAILTWALVASMLLTSGLAVYFMLPVPSTIVPAAPLGWNGLFLPFGVFLFSLSGLPIIGEAVELVERRPRLAWRAVIIGTLGAALLAWIWAMALAHAGGSVVLSDPLALTLLLPADWRWLLLVTGFLAVITSYATTAYDLKETLQRDFGWPQMLAASGAVLTPFLLVLYLKPDFVTMVDVVGGIFTGLNGMLVALMAVRLKPRSVRAAFPAFISLPGIAPWIVLGVYALGMLHIFWT